MAHRKRRPLTLEGQVELVPVAKPELNVAPLREPVSLEELLGEAAVLPPALPDPAEELATAIHHCVIDMLTLHDYLGQVGSIRGFEQYLAGPKRLLEAIKRYEDRTFDLEANLTRVLKTKTKRPAAITPLREPINRTLEKCGYDVPTFWKRWNESFGPVEKDAKAKAVRRATKA
jgi:hypothetical protein